MRVEIGCKTNLGLLNFYLDKRSNHVVFNRILPFKILELKI